jgi:uncharacterized 2Fe-2S/4Fe-4S cluster protein (DUF4445 family)
MWSEYIYKITNPITAINTSIQHTFKHMTVLNMAAYKRDITFKDYSSKLCRKKTCNIVDWRYKNILREEIQDFKHNLN